MLEHSTLLVARSRVGLLVSATLIAAGCTKKVDTREIAPEVAETKEAVFTPDGPDLGIDQARLESSVRVVTNATVQQAEVDEGCAAATTGRTLVRFDVKTPNHGPADLEFGRVTCASTDPRPQCNGVSCFESPACCCNGNSECTTSSGRFAEGFAFACPHRHIHFNSFAEYRLLTLDGDVAAIGHKQSFCLMDIEGIDGGPCNTDDPFTCGNQGIHAGCADVYSSALPCSYVDATGVPRGDYILEVQIDPLDIINESSEDNNVARVPVTIESGPPPIEPPSRHRFLVRDGVGTEAEALDYYGRLSPDGFDPARYSLDQWLVDIMGNRPTVSALYQNINELGFWREMTCTATIARADGGCWVRNWADVNDPDEGEPNLGTVTMRLDVDGRVQFFVFGPDGRLSPFAILDDEGEKFVPRLCTNCHGGEYRGVGAASDLGSVFREFEPSLLARAPGVTEVEAQGQWRRLNAAIRSGNAAVRTEAEGGPFPVDLARTSSNDYVDAMYAEGDVARPVDDPLHLPASWRTGNTERERATKADLWRRVVNPYCMSCHRLSEFNYNNYSRFRTLAGITDGRALLRRYIEEDPADPDRQQLSFMPQSKLQWTNLNTDAEALIAIERWLGDENNRAPTADAGPDQVVRGGTDVQLSAEGSSDPDNDPIVFRWTQIAGPAVELSPSETARDVTFSAPDVEEETAVTFRLVVTDTRERVAEDLVAVTLAPSSQLVVTAEDTPLRVPDADPAGVASTIDITEDRAITAMTVAVTIDHTWIGDLLVVLEGPGGFSRTLHNRSGRSEDDIHRSFLIPQAVGLPTQGPWRLRISDHASRDLGILQSWRMELETAERPANRPPIARASDDVAVGSRGTVLLTAAASADPDGDALAYRWSVVDGPPVQFAPSADSREVSFVAPEVVVGELVLTVRLSVEDGRGGVDEDTVQITVAPGAHEDIEATATDTPMDVPDNTASGVVSSIAIAQEEVIDTAEVTVSIDHTWIGDLRVVLMGPGDFTQVLHDRTGRSERDIRRTYSVTGLRGRRTGGTWRLAVSDHARRDIGVLREFTLTLHVDHGDNPPDPDPDPPGTIDVVADGMPLTIPDANTVGVSSSVDVDQAATIEAMTVRVDIDHSWIGDLTVSLIAPNEQQVSLHQRTGGNQDDIRRSFTVDALVGASTQGTWRLSVSDGARFDVGELEGWSIHFDTR